MYLLIHTVTGTYNSFTTLQEVADWFKQRHPLADRSYFRLYSVDKPGIDIEYIVNNY